MFQKLNLLKHAYNRKMIIIIIIRIIICFTVGTL